MAKRTLVTDVYVDGERYAAGTAESDLPKDVEITNPKAWSDYEGDDGPLGPRQAAASSSGTEVPPKTGRGSGRDVWADYAEANGVDVSADDSKDAIITACEAAGVATE